MPPSREELISGSSLSYLRWELWRSALDGARRGFQKRSYLLAWADRVQGISQECVPMAWPHVLTTLLYTGLLPGSLLHGSWTMSKAGRHFHAKEHEYCIIQTGKRWHPILIWVTPVVGTSQGLYWEQDIWWVCLAYLSWGCIQDFSFCLKLGKEAEEGWPFEWGFHKINKLDDSV